MSNTAGVWELLLCPSGSAAQGVTTAGLWLTPFSSPAARSCSLSTAPCPGCPRLGEASLTFFPPGEDVSGGGVLVMFRGLEPQLDGDDPLILKHAEKQGMD